MAESSTIGVKLITNYHWVVGECHSLNSVDKRFSFSKGGNFIMVIISGFPES